MIEPVLLSVGPSKILKGFGIFSQMVIVLSDCPPPPTRRGRPSKRDAFFCKLNPLIPLSGIRQLIAHDAESAYIIWIDGQCSIDFNTHPLGLAGREISLKESHVG